MWKLYIWYLVFLTIYGVSCNKKAFNFLQTQVAFNPFYLSDHQIMINPDHTTLNITLDIARNFTHDAWVHLGVHHKSSNAETYRSLFSYDINICQFLGRNVNKNLGIAQLWINNFLKYGTLPRSCPFLKGNYYWYNLRTDKISIPTFLMNGRYRLIINTYFQSNALSNRLLNSVANLTLLAVFK